MRKYLGVKTIKKDQIKYPSLGNPRFDGLSPEDPTIKNMALSITNQGLLVPPMLRQLPDGHDPIDGDRRLIAWFDLLHHKEIQASIYVVEDEREVKLMRLAANWDRVDFTPVEKGRYIWGMVEDLMKIEGIDDVEGAWEQRELRGKFTREIANTLAKPASTIGHAISAFHTLPRDVRELIARNREELERKPSLSKAMSAVIIGERVGDVHKTFVVLMGLEVGKDQKSTVTRIPTVKELDYLKGATRQKLITTVDQVRDVVESKHEETLVPSPRFYIPRSEMQDVSKLASDQKVGVDLVIRGAVIVARSHGEELSSILKDLHHLGG